MAAWVPNRAGGDADGNVTSATVTRTVEYIHNDGACALPVAAFYLCTPPNEWLPQP